MAQKAGDAANLGMQELCDSLRPSVGAGKSARKSGSFAPTHTSAQSSARPSFTFNQPFPQRNPVNPSHAAMAQNYSPSLSYAGSHDVQNPSTSDKNTKDERTANLLNLLKFNNPASSPQPQSYHTPETPTTSRQLHSNPGPASAHSVHGRGISASDLVASLTGNKPSAPTSRETTPAPPNHQDLLLSLLNRSSVPQPSTAKDNALPKSPLHEANVNAVAENLASTTLR